VNSAADNIIGLYQRHGAQWDADRRRARFVEKDWLNRFVALLPAGGHVLDIGCGGAEPMAGYLIGKGFAVTGVDSAPVMIALCHDRHPRQQWMVHDMRTLALGRRFDGILAWDSFFHLNYDDQRRMFPVFGAHATPSAPLLFSSGPRHGEGIGTFGGEPLYHASLAPEEYRSLLSANGFSVVAYVPDDPTCAGHTVWLAQRDKAS
jgi:SAM-dependent methyltransferase